MLTFLLLCWLQIWQGKLQPTRVKGQTEWTDQPRLPLLQLHLSCAPIVKSQGTLWIYLFLFILSLGKVRRSPEFIVSQAVQTFTICNVYCWGVLFSFSCAHSYRIARCCVDIFWILSNPVSLGMEMGSEGGWAPEFVGLVPLNSCKSAASSSSQACGQYKTPPLVKEFTSPSGLSGAPAALPNCLLGCETVPACERVAPFPVSCKSAATLTSFQVGVC